MKIIKQEDKDWEVKEGYSKKIYLAEEDLGIPGALIQQIKIKSGKTARAHHHKIQTEIFYFLNNNGYWNINGKKFIPDRGDVLVIEPDDIHEVVNNMNEDYLYLAFKYNYNKEDIFWD